MKLTGSRQVFALALLQGFVLLAWFSLLFVFIGLARFGVDWWNYSHTPMAARIALDYRGLWIVLSGVVMFGFCAGVVLLLARLSR